MASVRIYFSDVILRGTDLVVWETCQARYEGTRYFLLPGGRKRVFEKGENEVFIKLKSLEDEVPNWSLLLSSVIRVTVQENFDAAPAKLGRYEERVLATDRVNKATVTQTAHGYRLKLESLTLRDAQKFYSRLRAGKIEPVDNWEAPKPEPKKLRIRKDPGLAGVFIADLDIPGAASVRGNDPYALIAKLVIAWQEELGIEILDHSQVLS